MMLKLPMTWDDCLASRVLPCDSKQLPMTWDDCLASRDLPCDAKVNHDSG